MPKHLLLGTRNPARIEMVRKILRGSLVQMLTLDDLGITLEVEEDGSSTEANAVKKARAYYSLSRVPTLAIDGGLRIDRFPTEKQPGVLVKRWPGVQAATTEADLLEYYRSELQLVGGESPATWTASNALAISDHQVLTHTYSFGVRFTAVSKGALAPGRVLDSLMIDPQSGKYYTELPLEERPYYKEMVAFILGNIALI